MSQPTSTSERPVRTLITGGFGFLATWIAAGLRRSGHEVILVDNRSIEGSSLELSGLLPDPMIQVGFADISMGTPLDAFGDVDYVVHAAALLGVNKVRNAPEETLRVNVNGTAVALDYARRLPALLRFVLISTSEVYGSDAGSAEEQEWLSVRTDDPRWSYAVSKVMAEAMVAASGTEHRLPYVIVRPFNVYGPYRTGSYAVGEFADRAAAGAPITVHGDGMQSRAWCHAEDFANGLIRCMHSDSAVGKTFNLGDDRFGMTIAELADLTVKISGSVGGIQYVTPDGPDIRSRKPDLRRARTLVGHQPMRDLDDGLLETIEWVRDGRDRMPLVLQRDDWPVWNAREPRVEEGVPR
jgi:nucleoside-diphosphate-sugar epimerase